MTEHTQSLLKSITELSREFGTVDYVRGGGGNTSAKNESTLWVKPSGTTLAGLTPEAFVAMSREKLGGLYAVEPPAEALAREGLVKRIMEDAVLPTSSGRASVEAPLHDSLSYTFVVHTHPALVNGMTCARNGRQACADLFPDAMWLDYIDPGFTLCMQVREEIQAFKAFKALNGREPQLIFLKNHGVFVAANTPDEIRALYARVMGQLRMRYEQAGIALALPVREIPDVTRLEALTEQVFEFWPDQDAGSVAISGLFGVATGPISPDHIVYSKSVAFFGEPTRETVQAFINQHGYAPRVAVTDCAVLGIGSVQKRADLALEMALDGALVEQLAQAFGGIEYMTDQAREFIENWEVESYRSKQV